MNAPHQAPYVVVPSHMLWFRLIAARPIARESGDASRLYHQAGNYNQPLIGRSVTGDPEYGRKGISNVLGKGEIGSGRGSFHRVASCCARFRFKRPRWWIGTFI